MALENGFHVVGQGVVDAGFNIPVKAQQALAGRVVRAVFNVVQQHLFVPPGEGLLAAEMRQHFIAAQPLLPALAADGTGCHCADQLGAFGNVHGRSAPAAQNWRIKQQHAAHGMAAQQRVAGCAHQA